MTYEIKPNTGSLFKNDRRETDTQPTHRGNIFVTAPGHYKVSGWVNTTQDGNKYLSFKLTPKDQVPAPAKPTQTAAEEMDDTIPF